MGLACLYGAAAVFLIMIGGIDMWEPSTHADVVLLLANLFAYWGLGAVCLWIAQSLLRRRIAARRWLLIPQTLLGIAVLYGTLDMVIDLDGLMQPKALTLCWLAGGVFAYLVPRRLLDLPIVREQLH